MLAASVTGRIFAMFDRIYSRTLPYVGRLGIQICLFSLVFGALTATVFAKDGSARRHPVSGKVEDSLGRPLAEVRIIIQNGSGAPIERGLTSPNGKYSFSDIKPGIYELIAEKAGFRKGAAVLNSSTHKGK
jgi:hypothetical protein